MTWLYILELRKEYKEFENKFKEEIKEEKEKVNFALNIPI